MTTRFSALLMAGALALVSACGQQTQVEPITPEPVFNKYGSVVGCRGGDGTVSSVTGSIDDPCTPPPECEDGSTAAGGPLCWPPGRDDNGPDRDPDPQTPTRPAT